MSVDVICDAHDAMSSCFAVFCGVHFPLMFRLARDSDVFLGIRYGTLKNYLQWRLMKDTNSVYMYNKKKVACCR